MTIELAANHAIDLVVKVAWPQNWEKMRKKESTRPREKEERQAVRPESSVGRKWCEEAG